MGEALTQAQRVSFEHSFIGGLIGADEDRSKQLVRELMDELAAAVLAEVRAQAAKVLGEERVVAAYDPLLRMLGDEMRSDARRIEATLELERATVLVTGGLDRLWEETVAAGADARAATSIAAASTVPWAATVTLPRFAGGIGWLVALAMLGLVPFGMGLIRLGDFVNRSYTIGESHGASFHVPPQGLPDGEYQRTVATLETMIGNLTPA